MYKCECGKEYEEIKEALEHMLNAPNHRMGKEKFKEEKNVRYN
jgi:hypothetical protein